MFTMAEIARCMNTADAAYAIRKRRGGDNALKGYTFEVTVAMQELATRFAHWLGDGWSDSSPIFVEQGNGFVDDLAIWEPDRKSAQFFQIKAGTIHWFSGKRSLVGDFGLQLELCMRSGIKATMTLAVSAAKANELPRAPDGIQMLGYEHVRMPHGVNHSEVMREVFDDFCPRPSADARFTSAIALKAAWDAADGRGSVRDFAHDAVSISAKSLPTLGPALPIEAEELRALNAIPEVRWRVVGRTIAFAAGDGRAVVTRFRDDEQFVRFMDALKDAPPAGFVELKVLAARFR